MTKRMLIDARHPEETRVVIADDSRIQEFDFVTSGKRQIKGNIYLAKITRVEPSLQAAFVEYGGGKQGFLPFGEIHPDYYQIPVSDRKRLIEEQEAMMAAEEAEEARREAAEEGNAESDQEAQEPAESALDDDTGADASASEEPMPWTADFGSAPEDGEHLETEAEPKSAEPTHYEAAAVSEPVERSEPVEHSEPATEEAATELLDAQAATTADGEPQADATPPTDEVETIINEEEQIRRPKKSAFTRRYKIQEVIKRNQIVLVQVIKEERGNKGVSLSTYISLAGRYCVLMPNSPKDGGISRKISGSEDRRRLKEISSELKVTKGMSAIIRTAGIDRTRAEIKRDYDYLVKLWNVIREQTLSSTAPALIYEEGNVVKRSIRDLYNNDLEEIMVEGDEAYREAKEFMKMILPSHAPRVKAFKGSLPIFYAYDIEDQLLSMHDPVVKLRSGGYIVINPTEALISIDVNSGRATGERNIEETATKTNLEAVTEITRQVRLRDLAGLIVIDFIDMSDFRNRRSVEKSIKDALKVDRAKIQISRISAFGLMEMSRQRLRPSISEANTVTCPHCQGRGFIRSNESLSIQIIRALEKEASTGSFVELTVVTSPAMATYLFNAKRADIAAIEKQFDLQIGISIDDAILPAGFKVEKTKRGGGRDRDRDRDRDRERPAQDANPRRGRSWKQDNRSTPEEAEHSNVEVIEDTPLEETEGAGSSDGKSRRRRGGRRRGGRDRDRSQESGGDSAAESAVEAVAHNVDEQPSAPSPEGDDAESPRRRGGRGRGSRGGRGRRKWREKDGKPEGAAEPVAAEGKVAWSSDMLESEKQWIKPTQEPNLKQHYKESTSLNGDRTPISEPRQHSFPEMGSPTERTVSSAPQDGGDSKSSSSRKGWWKRMVDSE